MKKIKSIIQLVLANKLINRTLKLINIIVLGIASSNRLFSIIYHILFFHTYSREQHAVLKGRFKYFVSLNKNRENRVEMRRNIHRIEKGLIMEPSRDRFALNYIEETINTFEKAANQLNSSTKEIDCEEIVWARDVLTKYFNTVENDNFIKGLRDKFENIELNCDIQNEIKSPYEYNSIEKSGITYDEFLRLSKQRRSVRWFQSKAVPHDLIDKALLAARQSPSACNRLPYEYRFFDKPELVRKVANIPFGATGYAHNIPTIAVLIGKQNSYFSPRDRHVIYIDASLSAMAFMLALETLGLSSSVINWPDFEPVEIQMQKTLGLKTYERPVLLIAIGYARSDGGIPYSQKKNLESIRSYNNEK